MYRKNCTPFVLCSSQILFYSPVVVSDSLQGAGYWSLQQSIGGVDFGFQSCLLSYPNKSLIWMLEAWDSKPFLVDMLQAMNTGKPYAGGNNRPVWTTDFTLPWVDITSDFHMTELNMTLDLQAAVIIRNSNGEIEESSTFRLPRSVMTALTSYSLTCVGYGDSSAATFNNIQADISHKTSEEVSDLAAYGFPAPDTDPPFPCNIFTSFEGSNATQTLTLNNLNQVNITTDLTPWKP